MSTRSFCIPLLPASIRWLLVAVVVATIVVFSLLPPPPETQTSLPYLDKLVHAVAYLGLAGALAYATVEYQPRHRLRTALVWGLAVGVGLAVELLQSVVAYRFFTLGDLVANAVGAGLILIWFRVERSLRYTPVSEW